MNIAFVLLIETTYHRNFHAVSFIGLSILIKHIAMAITTLAISKSISCVPSFQHRYDCFDHCLLLLGGIESRLILQTFGPLLPDVHLSLWFPPLYSSLFSVSALEQSTLSLLPPFSRSCCFSAFLTCVS